MEFSAKRVFGAAVVALALTVGAGIAPAAAASNPLVTVKGHVVDPDGNPVAGITVQSDCGCDYEGGAPTTHLSGTDTTSKTGLFAYRVRKSTALNISFNDPDKVYLPVGRSAGTTKKTSTGYIIDVEMEKASFIEGTIVDNLGEPAGAEVSFYDAATGKGSGSGFSEKDGTFRAELKSGDYKVKFGGPSYYLGEQWLGGAATRDESPTVSVGYGATVTGINGTLQLKPSISGVLKIDGKNLKVDSGERIAVELYNEAGERVERRAVTTGWSFVELTPNSLPAGTYTLKFRPTNASSDFFAPFSQTVVLPAGGAVKKLIVNTESIPASSTDKRKARVALGGVKPYQPQNGDTLRTKISSFSYGSTAGATVKIYVAGKKVATKKLNSAGRVNWTYTLKGLSKGYHSIRIVYSGTSTTLASKGYTYGFYQQ
jgi:hypothetical protein